MDEATWLSSTHFEKLYAHVKSGQGMALVDPSLFADELSNGSLVRPFEAALDGGYGYYLITPPEELGDSAVALFRSWLIERFGTRSSDAQPTLQLAVSNE